VTEAFSSPSAAASALVVLRIAGRPGPAFPLDPAADNVLGRGAGSLVVLADRLASRSHAALRFDPASDTWMLRDLGSRNGTWVDGVRVSEAALVTESTIRVGMTELVFRTTPPAATPAPPTEDARLVRSGPPAELEGSVLRRMAASGDDTRWPMLLYQSGVRLLGAESPWQVVCTTLELATEFTAATSFGWFDAAPPAGLVPVCVIPPGTALEALLVGTATREASAGRAAWLATPAAEVACVPLVDGQRVRGVLAAAAPAGGLKEADFDLLVTLASLAAAAAAGRGRPEPAATDALDHRPADDEDRADELSEGTLALSGADLEALGIGSSAAAPLVPAGTGTLVIEDWQRALVIEALRRSGGSVPEAAALLGISRATLYRKLEAWGLSRDGRPPPA
jgi:hypothetical protein